MRQASRFSTVFTFALAPIAALVLGFPESASATVTIAEVDENTISGIEGSGTSTVIYGGVSGPDTRGTCGTFDTNSPLTTCNNCESGVAAGDAGLVPCNRRRIHPRTQLRMRLSSDTTDGYPVMTVVNSSGVQVEVTSAVTKGSISKGTIGEIRVEWQELCSKLGGNTNCDPASDLLTGTVKVGIDKDNNGTLDTGDDSTNLTVKVLDSIATEGSGANANASLAKDCNNTAAVGICYFEVISGDKKLTLTNMNAINGFPLTTNTSFKWVRVFFSKRADPSSTTTQADFDVIQPGSDFADLEIGGVTDAITLTPARVVGLENDQTYDVRVAVVDVAGNTGYYSNSSLDLACDNVSSNHPTTGVPECHVARPSEVVGILSEPVNCFVATAAYGSPLEKEVTTFRAFRERFLMRSELGKSFIRAYYHYGPKAAKFISSSDTRRSIARAALALPLAFSKFALREGGYAAIGLLVVIFGSPVAVALFAWIRRKRGLRA